MKDRTLPASREPKEFLLLAPGEVRPLLGVPASRPAIHKKEKGAARSRTLNYLFDGATGFLAGQVAVVAYDGRRLEGTGGA